MPPMNKIQVISRAEGEIDHVAAHATSFEARAARSTVPLPPGLGIELRQLRQAQHEARARLTRLKQDLSPDWARAAQKLDDALGAAHALETQVRARLPATGVRFKVVGRAGRR